MNNYVGRIVFLERAKRGLSDYDGEYAVVKQSANTLFGIPMNGGSYGVTFDLKTIEIVDRATYRDDGKTSFDFKAFIVDVRDDIPALQAMVRTMYAYADGTMFRDQPNGKDQNNGAYRAKAAANAKLLELAIKEREQLVPKSGVDTRVPLVVGPCCEVPLRMPEPSELIPRWHIREPEPSELVPRWHIRVVDHLGDTVKYRASLLHAPSEAELIDHLKLGMEKGGAQIAVVMVHELRRKPEYEVGDVFLYNDKQHIVIHSQVMNNEEVVYTIDVKNADGSSGDIRTIKEKAIRSGKLIGNVNDPNFDGRV